MLLSLFLDSDVLRGGAFVKFSCWDTSALTSEYIGCYLWAINASFLTKLSVFLVLFVLFEVWWTCILKCDFFYNIIRASSFMLQLSVKLKCLVCTAILILRLTLCIGVFGGLRVLTLLGCRLRFLKLKFLKCFVSVLLVITGLMIDLMISLTYLNL